MTREEQLKRLKTELPELLATIQFWIADMLAFSSNEQARERLQVPVDDGALPFFNQVYYTSSQAQFLAQQVMPNGDLLENALQELLHDKAKHGATELCTSYDLAPFFREAFDISSNFHKNARFKQDYKMFEKQWTKQQKKLAKMKRWERIVWSSC